MILPQGPVLLRTAILIYNPPKKIIHLGYFCHSFSLLVTVSSKLKCQNDTSNPMEHVAKFNFKYFISFEISCSDQSSDVKIKFRINSQMN